MRHGWRAFDADTHVNPAAEVLERYVDPDFRPRLAELAPAAPLICEEWARVRGAAANRPSVS